MDFLILMRGLAPMPLSNEELSERAFGQLAYWDRLLEEGKVVFTAPYVGKRARVAIYRVDSLVELMELLNADPMFAYMERDVIPLSDGQELRKVYANLRDEGTK